MQVAFYLAEETTQVLDAIPWVRCASGNVLKIWMGYLWEKTSLLKEAISLPINCKILKLFPEGVATEQTTPRRTFPVKSQDISFYRSVTLAQTTDYFPSLCDTSRLLLWDKVIHFLAKNFSHRIASSGFALAFGNLLYIDNLRLPEDLPKHHPCWLEELDLDSTFTFQGRHCRQPSFQARVNILYTLRKKTGKAPVPWVHPSKGVNLSGSDIWDHVWAEHPRETDWFA